MEMKTVEAGLLYRGRRPRTLGEIQWLARHGIKKIVNLESGFYEWFRTKRNQEMFWCQREGIEYVHLKCHPIMPPTVEEINFFLTMIVGSKGMVYVHCLHGHERTGIMCGFYRIIFNGWSSWQAQLEMIREGFHWRFFGWWLQIRPLQKFSA